jgi:hypothetical protein
MAGKTDIAFEQKLQVRTRQTDCGVASVLMVMALLSRNSD